MKLDEVVVCIEYYNIIKFFKYYDETQKSFMYNTFYGQ